MNRLPTIYEFRVAAVDRGLIGEWAALNVTLSSRGELQGYWEVVFKDITLSRENCGLSS